MANRPKPTALKVLQGNPGKRKLNLTEPPTKRGEPDMPAVLTPLAQDEWKRIVPLLTEMQVLTTVDGAALANYCMTFARWREAEACITKFGMLVEEPIVNKDGNKVGTRLKSNPACRIALACQKEMRVQLSAFGMDPSSRSRIKGATQEPQKSPLLQLLERQQARRTQARNASS